MINIISFQKREFNKIDFKPMDIYKYKELFINQKIGFPFSTTKLALKQSFETEYFILNHLCYFKIELGQYNETNIKPIEYSASMIVSFNPLERKHQKKPNTKVFYSQKMIEQWFRLWFSNDEYTIKPIELKSDNDSKKTYMIELKITTTNSLDMSKFNYLKQIFRSFLLDTRFSKVINQSFLKSKWVQLFAERTRAVDVDAIYVKTDIDQKINVLYIHQKELDQYVVYESIDSCENIEEALYLFNTQCDNGSIEPIEMDLSDILIKYFKNQTEYMKDWIFETDYHTFLNH